MMDVTTMPAAPGGSFVGEASCTPFSTSVYEPGTSTGTLPATMFPELVETIE